MGFLTYLAYKIIIEPTAELSTQLLKKIQDIAYQEICDPEKIKAAMEENELLYKSGEITEEEFEKRRAEMIDKSPHARRRSKRGKRDIEEEGEINAVFC